MRVLIVIHTNTYFTGMFPLGMNIKDLYEIDPVVLFAEEYPTLAMDVESCEAACIPVVFGPDVKPLFASVIGSVDARKKNRNFKSFSYLIRQILRRLFAGSVLLEFFDLHQQSMWMRRLLRQQNIKLVILPSDNRYNLSVYVKAAHLENVGVVVVPQFMAGPLEWAEYVLSQPAYWFRYFINRLAGTMYPRWVLEYKNRKLVALPGAQILAREWLGAAPPLPWVLHSGASDVIAVESGSVKEYCFREGLPLYQVTVTGSIAHDVLFDAQNNKKQRKEDLLNQLGVDTALPIILSALPPDSLYMDRPECDFKSYRELIEFWCRSITMIKGYNHLVVLHPSLIFDEIKYIEDFGLKIVRASTANIVPLCDIFVAAVSSTIQWAIACGIPVVNYDVYRYRYTDYAEVGGVISLEEKNEFIETLFKLANDSTYYAKIVAAQRAEAFKWGRLDGQAGSRLQEVFLSVIAKYDREKEHE